MIKNIFIILLITFFSLLFVGGAFLCWGIYLPKDNLNEEIFFIVRTGDGLSVVAENLEKEGVIKESRFFVIYGVVTEKGKILQPGHYNLSSSMSVAEVAEKIATGGENRLTVIEGWNLRDIAGFLEKNGYGEKDDFYRLVGKPPLYENGKLTPHQKGELNVDLKIFASKPQDISLEGYLFPDTYFISPGTSMEEIINSLLSNFERRVTPEIEKMIEESEMSLFEVVTVASLIEKEVISFEDKKIVSGIIQKRLQRGMRLQIDATVTYLTGRRSVQIPISETKIDSPYNTYIYSGLPKGPICNPGMESVIAALSPAESDYLYYLSKPTGKTVFSKTHEEHVKAKNNYLRNNQQ